MRSVRIAIAAVVLAASALVASPQPVAAHGAYPHWQWRWSGCVAGLSWAYGDPQENYAWTDDARHNHAWNRDGYVLRTEGDLQSFWRNGGWECGYIGYPTGSQQQWIDGGRLVKRQTFSRRTVQLVYYSTTGCACGGHSASAY